MQQSNDDLYRLQSKSKQLQLKYQPNPYRWKQQFIQQQQYVVYDRTQESTIAQLNKTLLLAQRLFNDLKINTHSRKPSVIPPTPRVILDKATYENKRFHMYSTSKQTFFKRSKNNSPNTGTTNYHNVSLNSKTEDHKLQSSAELRYLSKPKTSGFKTRPIGNITTKQQQHTNPMNSINLKSIKDFKQEHTLISAKSWIVINAETGEMLTGNNQYMGRQIASITKVMTCWLTLQLCQELELDIDDTKFIVPIEAERIGGTTADLKCGDILSIRDLLYGLMLPSGNDAAITLAHNFQKYSTSRDYFINQMNKWAQIFKLTSTHFANPHGLSNDNSVSTAYDVSKLAQQAIKNVILQKIVKTKVYFTEIEDAFGSIKEMFWENTNKMLYQGFKGIKTGNTSKAGPCVVEYYNDDNISVILVLLNCRSPDQRWNDVNRILELVKKEYC